MTFIECFPGEKDSALFAIVRQAYASCFGEDIPDIEFGQLIAWRSRLFREVLVSGESEQILIREDRLFHSFGSDQSRATMQVGSFEGIVFETPPSPGAELVARLIDRGSHSIVQPLIYEKGT